MTEHDPEQRAVDAIGDPEQRARAEGAEDRDGALRVGWSAPGERTGPSGTYHLPAEALVATADGLHTAPVEDDTDAAFDRTTPLQLVRPEQRADRLDKVGIIRENGYEVQTTHTAGPGGLRAVEVVVHAPDGRKAAISRTYHGSVETTGQLAGLAAFDDALRALAVDAGVEAWTDTSAAEVTE